MVVPLTAMSSCVAPEAESAATGAARLVSVAPPAMTMVPPEGAVARRSMVPVTAAEALPAASRNFA